MSFQSIRTLLATKGAAPVLGTTLVLGLGACSDSAGPDEGVTTQDIAGEDAGGADEPFEVDAETAEVFENFDTFTDQTVTVSAQVEQVFSERAFTLRGGDEGEILVVGATSLGVTLEPNMIAQVNGLVQSFNLAAVEQALGEDLADESFSPFEGQNFIIADNVDLLSGENGGVGGGE